MDIGAQAGSIIHLIIFLNYYRDIYPSIFRLNFFRIDRYVSSGMFEPNLSFNYSAHIVPLLSASRYSKAKSKFYSHIVSSKLEAASTNSEIIVFCTWIVDGSWFIDIYLLENGSSNGTGLSFRRLHKFHHAKGQLLLTQNSISIEIKSFKTLLKRNRILIILDKINNKSNNPLL